GAHGVDLLGRRGGHVEGQHLRTEAARRADGGEPGDARADDEDGGGRRRARRGDLAGEHPAELGRRLDHGAVARDVGERAEHVERLGARDARDGVERERGDAAGGELAQELRPRGGRHLSDEHGAGAQRGGSRLVEVHGCAGHGDDVGGPCLLAGHHDGARRLVRRVREARTRPGSRRDHDVVPEADQPAGRRGGGGHQRPAVVRYADPHVTLLAHVRNLACVTTGRAMATMSARAYTVASSHHPVETIPTSHRRPSDRRAESTKTFAEQGGHVTLYAERERPDDLVQSVARALRVLEVVTRTPGLPVKAIARRSGLNLSTTYHLVRTLAYAGYVARLKDGTYDVGEQISNRFYEQLGSLGRGPDTREVLRHLAQSTGFSAYLGRISAGRVVIVDYAEAPGSPYVEDLERGLDVSAHATALGKALLLGMSRRERHELVVDAGMRKFTPRTATDISALDSPPARMRPATAAAAPREF